MVEFRTASKGRKEYSKVIMPEEKDKILYELLNKEGNGFYFEYKKQNKMSSKFLFIK